MSSSAILKFLLAAAGTLALLLGGPAVAHARIESLDLPTMLRRAEGAVYGEIVAREVFFAPEADGPGLYFTRLTIEGVTLEQDHAIRVDVLHVGGVIDEHHGAYVSEAPNADDTAPGTRVVAFYAWVDDLGAGVAGNALYGAQGGLYRAVQGPLGPTVLGRGAGFAVSSNVSVGKLGTAVRTLAAAPR
jgi:hypothetical protein